VGEAARQVGGQRCLAAAAFRIGNQNRAHLRSSP
jgi:hypothetical protein